ncbi:MAG TPA: acetate uptake transporter [Acidimicrobiales bacterium]|nr:acetate uptake transporter [Acidimicrobiales bacterium]
MPPETAATALEFGEEPMPEQPTWHRAADPAPLGLAGFAMTTFALSLSNADIWGPAAASALALALVYGGGVQLLAGMWEFVRRNTFGAMVFSSYGAFWISYYVLAKFVLTGASASAANIAAGTFLLGWTIFTFYMTIASLRVSGAIVAVFVPLTATFVLLTIGAFQSNVTITHWGGYIGIATAAAAWYASFAGVVNETFKRVLIPTLPLGPRPVAPVVAAPAAGAAPSPGVGV